MTTTRESAFRAALALRKTTAAAVAARIGITPQALGRIVAGRTRSRRVEKSVDKYIRETARMHDLRNYRSAA